MSTNDLPFDLSNIYNHANIRLKSKINAEIEKASYETRRDHDENHIGARCEEGY
jgi:hypothetical protein